MLNKLKWYYRDFQRLRRLLFPERSVALLIQTVGAFWLWRHGVKREHKIRLWSSGHGWYAADLAIPNKKLIVEADGWVHIKRRGEDHIRDFRLHEKGWKILRIDDIRCKMEPRAVRRDVRKFLKG